MESNEFQFVNNDLASCLKAAIGTRRSTVEHAHLVLRPRVQIDGHNEAVQTKHLREDENQNHTHVQTLLLSVASYTGVPHNANSEASGQTTEAYR